MKTVKVMGIINATPDSFSQDGSVLLAHAYRRAMNHIEEGADFIDIGGESTRPGATPISEREELKRIYPLIVKVLKLHRVPISVDTHKLNVAKACLDAGVQIINNVQGTQASNTFFKMVARYKVHLVLMHMRGTPQNMTAKTRYQKLIPDIIAKLKTTIEKCLENGIKSDKLIIDPGIGFAKTAQQNLKILHELKNFKRLKTPILIGVSRKSFIGSILQADVDHRLFGTIAANLYAAKNGADILRVHDVKPMKDALAVWTALEHQNLTHS